MRKRLGKSTRKLGIVREEVNRAPTSQHIDHDINGRVFIYSLHRKLQKVDGNINDIYDPHGTARHR